MDQASRDLRQQRSAGLLARRAADELLIAAIFGLAGESAREPVSRAHRDAAETRSPLPPHAMTPRAAAKTR